MDSSVAVLVETLQKVRKTGGKVYLTNLQPRVQGLIEIARLGTIFVHSETKPRRSLEEVVEVVGGGWRGRQLPDPPPSTLHPTP